MLFTSGCERDFSATSADAGGRHDDPDGAPIDASDLGPLDDLLPPYPDMGPAPRDLSQDFPSCAPAVTQDGGIAATFNDCQKHSDWYCGAECGAHVRLLCLNSQLQVQREIRCDPSNGHCYCGVGGSWSACQDTNSGRPGCIRAREAFTAGCCRPQP